MPSIKAIAHCFFKIRIDRVNDQSVGICNICGEEYYDAIGNYGNFKRLFYPKLLLKSNFLFLLCKMLFCINKAYI
jgi:hypothetical protein